MSVKRQEWHHLLVSVKSTVEGILASQSVNVWNTYGGLERLSKNIQHILSHDLKVPQGHSYNDVDFWPFVRALRWIDSAKWRAMESSRSGSSLARVWLRQSLLNLNLSSQLVSLVSHSEHLHQHYEDDAFLCQKEYFQALVICLQALEQNSPALLADINASLITQHIKKKARRPTRQHLNRSASLPVDPAESDDTMIRRARTEDRLVPPLMSPKTESVLSTSYEHASICDSGTIPETAKEALLQALSKSGELVDLDDEDYYSFKSSYSTHRHSFPILNLYSQDLYSKGYHPQDPYARKHSQSDVSPHIPEVSNSDSSTFDVGFDSYAKKNNLLRTGVSSYTCIETFDSTNESKAFKSRDSHLTNQRDSTNSSKASSAQELQWNTSQHEIKKAPEYVSNNRSIVEDQADPLRSPTVLSMADLYDQDLDNQPVSRDSGISSVNQSSDNPLISPVSGLLSSNSSLATSVNLVTDKSPKKFTHQRSQSDAGVQQSPRHPTPQPLSKSPDTLDLHSAQRKRSLPRESEGFFSHPEKGQSLMSFLSSQDFHTCAELDKENAHFSISEALIAAIEQMKWNQVIRPSHPDILSDDGHESDEEIRELKQRIRIRRRERLKEKARGFPALSDGRTDTTTTTDSASIHSSSRSNSSHSDSESSSDEDIHDEEIDDTDRNDKISNLNSLKDSGLSLSMASLYSDADIQRSLMNLKRDAEIKKSKTFAEFASSSLVSAESVAISLLKKFSENQLPKASDLEWLVSEQDAPQRLLPLPNSYPVCPDDGENSDIAYGKRTRLRGNLEWAPPRPQIIVLIHPPPKRKVVLAKQNYRCAGCGAKVEPGYMKRYNYCEYLGKYFCPRCHCHKVAYIPGRILKKWNFTKYYVSNFAYDLLAKINRDPLFNIQDINSGLYRKVRALDLMRECREKLGLLQRYVDTCRLRSIKLADEFRKMPSHWLKDIHVYTLEELVAVRNGQLLPAVKTIVDNSIHHVSQCQLCRMKGFICELCNNEDEIIFPFELQRVIRCPVCSACYHNTCFIPEKCPKCVRIQARQNRLAAAKMNDSDEESDEKAEEEKR